MRTQLVTAILALIFCNILNAQTSSSTSSATSEYIGQVMYSILSPDQFNLLYCPAGDCDWVLMDGRDISGSKLAAIIGNTLPDAQGRFIRGMDPTNKLDPFASEIHRQRNVGETQSDALQQHTHYIDYNQAGGGAAGFGDHDIGRGQNGAYNKNETGSIFIKDVLEARTSTETRPANIALYIYIKIN